MKKLSLIALLGMISAGSAHASCQSAALWLAKNVYGNDPIKCRTTVVEAGKEYKVTVGIGNEEDGAHTYRVTFHDDSCNPNDAVICDLTQPSANGEGQSKSCPTS